MTDRPFHLSLLAFLLVCSLGTLAAAWQAHDWGDGLSLLDPHSEANTLRGVDGFRAQGIAHDSGLGNVLFDDRYPDYGFAADPPEKRAATGVMPDGVYTHYPPGPEYLLYVTEAIFGPHPVARLRILPLAVGWVATLYFGLCIRQRFGSATAWIVMLCCLAVPMFSDGNSLLHNLGYEFVLLLVELGIALGTNRLLLPFAALGFVQGWLSFDYAFLVAGAPLAVELAMPRLVPAQPIRWRLALGRCVLAGGGFTVAHALHFAELASYYGSVAAAVDNLTSAARLRAAGDHARDLAEIALNTAAILISAIFGREPGNTPFGSFDASMLWPFVPQDVSLRATWRACRFLGLTMGFWWPVWTLAVYVVVRWRAGVAAALRALGDWMVVSLLGFALAFCWSLIMQGHAFLNWHILYRHLFVWFFFCVLFLAVRLAPTPATKTG